MRYAQRFLLNNVVNSFSGQTLPDMFGDLSNELVGDDGDVPYARSANRAEGVIDDGPVEQRQERLLGVVGERMKPRTVPSGDEDGLHLHVFKCTEAALEDAY